MGKTVKEVVGSARIRLLAVSVNGRSWPEGDEPQIVWPVGPHYKKLSLSDDRSWVDCKLASADWYLQALRQLQSHGRPLDRYLGVEMAIDGVLAAQSSAIDAAVETLIRALERHLEKSGIAVPDTVGKRLWRAEWTVVIELAKLDPGLTLSSSVPAGTALIRDTKALKQIAPSVREKVGLDKIGGTRSPDQEKRLEALTRAIEQVNVGIVPEIRWLRNAMTHHNSLNRAFGAEIAPVALYSPLRIPKEPLAYLTQGLVEVRALAECILADAVALAR